MAEWLKAADCKSALIEYAGSNPALPTILILRNLGSRKAPFLLAPIFRAVEFRVTSQLLERRWRPLEGIRFLIHHLKLSTGRLDGIGHGRRSVVGALFPRC